MKIEWTYLPNVRPYIVDGSVWPRQREDGTWVLSSLLSDGSNFSGRNEGTRSDITAPIDARLGHHPAQSGINAWEWRRNFTFADREDFNDACTPRAPKAEWFGTGPGQWDAWWIESWGVLRKVRLEDDGSLEGDNEAGELVSMYFDPTCNVVPVAREGFPSSVGWKVVGE